MLAHKIREAMAAESRGSVMASNRTGKQPCVITIRERDGHALAGVFPSEDAAGKFRIVVGLVTKTGPSVDVCGERQRAHPA